MPMKIVILDGYASNPGDVRWDELAAFGELTVHERTARDEVVSRIKDAEIVFLNKTPVDASVFEQCKKLRMIGVLATGYDVVDVAAAAFRLVDHTAFDRYAARMMKKLGCDDFARIHDLISL